MPTEHEQAFMGACEALINRRLELAIEIARGGVGLDAKARRVAALQERINAIREALAKCRAESRGS
jgi:hypothetical protein